MAGLGFDAAIMADAPEGLKAKVGPAAYVVSGTRNLRGPQFKVRVKVEDQEEFTRRTRTVVIGNCGKLLGGLVLMPDAEVDDGQLDTVILSPKGVVGWAAVAARLATKKRKGHQIVDHYTSPSMQIRADRPQEVQIDGDTLGKAQADLRRGACPAPSSSAWGRSTDGRPARRRPGDAARAGRLGRGVLAMVLFVVPVRCSAFAVRQKFDPLITADNDVIRPRPTPPARARDRRRAASPCRRSASRSCSTALATALCACGRASPGSCATAPLWAFVTMMVSWNVGLLAKLLVSRARPDRRRPDLALARLLVPVGSRLQRRGRRRRSSSSCSGRCSARVGHRVSVALAVVGCAARGPGPGIPRCALPFRRVGGLCAGVQALRSPHGSDSSARRPSTSSVGPSHPA